MARHLECWSDSHGYMYQAEVIDTKNVKITTFPQDIKF